MVQFFARRGHPSPTMRRVAKLDALMFLLNKNVSISFFCFVTIHAFHRRTDAKTTMHRMQRGKNPVYTYTVSKPIVHGFENCTTGCITWRRLVASVSGPKHRRSQGCTGHVHPLGRKKLGPNLQGKVVSTPHKQSVHSQAKKSPFFRKFGRSGRWELII